MQLYDYYKKYGNTFLDSFEFMKLWGGTVPFKLMDNRICSDSLYTRKMVTKQLNQMFTIDSVSDEIHDKMLTLYFEALIEFNIIPPDTDFKSRLHFDSDKVQIFKKGSLYFRRPSTLQYPTNHLNSQLNSYDNAIFIKSIVDRVVFNQSIFINDENQYNSYTVMSNYGAGHIDSEFMKFSYYIIDGTFHFQPPKSSDNLNVVVTVPVSEIEDHYAHFKMLIKKRLFSVFYEYASRIVFRKVLDFSTFNDTHLAILNLLSDTSIKDFMNFMEENHYVDDVLSMSDDEVYDLYKISLTTFEMMTI